MLTIHGMSATEHNSLNPVHNASYARITDVTLYSVVGMRKANDVNGGHP